MNSSLRARLLIGMAATTAAVFVMAMVALYLLIRLRLLAEFDTLLAAKARTLATLVEQRDDRIEIQFETRQLQEFARQVSPEYFQVWRDDDTVLARSRRLESDDLPRLAGSLYAPGFRSGVLPDGRQGRFVGIRFLPAVEGETLDLPSLPELDDSDDGERDTVDFTGRHFVTLVVGRSTADIDLTLLWLRWLLGGTCLVSELALLTVLGWLVTHNLQPLERLAAQIGGIDSRSLSGRFTVANSPRELRPVVQRLNDLMQHLEQAFLREKTLTADVAHELRTPLAGLRSILDVVLRKPRETGEYREAITECLSICQDTQRMAESLLSLSRIEAGQVALERSFVDVDLFLKNIWEQHLQAGTTKRVHVHWSCASRSFLQTDSDQLRVVFSNIFHNALTYVDEGWSISVATQLVDDELLVRAGESSGRSLELRVQNTGCRVSAAHVDRVFERFWRADTARASTGTHAGLGLALCRRIIELLEGSITAQVDGEDFIVKIRFPPHLVEGDADVEAANGDACPTQAEGSDSRGRPNKPVAAH